jgi:putative PEP-CTERM system TPR-repeat lipoprotein
MDFMTRRRAGVALISALMLMVPLGGCEKLSHSTAQDHVQKAKDYQAKGELRSSIIELKSALQKSPNNAEARGLLGQLYIATGQGAEAEKELKKAQSLGMGEEAIKPLLGKALLLQGLYQRVLDEIQSTPQTSSINLARILELRGDAELGLRHLDQGCSLFRQSLESDAKYVPAYWGLAKCALAHQDLDRAHAELDAALKLDPDNVDSWLFSGDVNSYRGALPDAEKAYRSALKIAPRNIGAHLGLASVYIKKGELQKAAAEVQAARKLGPKELMVQYMSALVAYEQKQYAQARDTLQEVLRVDPDHMPSVLLSGAVGFALGTYEQAEQDLGRFLARFPDSAFARKMLAGVQLKTGQGEQALNTLKPLLAQEQPDVEVLALAADASLKTKNYPAASGYLKRAASIDPKSAQLHAQLGVSYLAAGESAHAIAELESAAQLDPGQFGADTVLIMTYLNRKEWDKALVAIDSLAKKLPNDATVYNFRGAAYAGKMDFANARKSFEQALAMRPPSSAAALNLAQLDVLDKHPDVARKRLETALAADKNNVQIMLALASLAGATGQEKQYGEWLERAEKADPKALQPRRLLVANYLKHNEPQKALILARELQTASPDSPDALDLLGSTQFAAGESDNALATYRELVAKAPRSPLAYYKLASAEALMKNTKAARASLSKALELKPNYPEAQSALISLDVQAGSFPAALKLAQQMQTEYPTSPIGHGLEGDILMAQKRYGDAERAYEKAFSMIKSGVFAVKIHQALSRAGNIQKADSGLLDWLRTHPDDLLTRSYLAESYGATGRNKQAIEQYQLILKSSPGNVTVLNNLAWLYFQEKDGRALQTAEEAYKVNPEVPFVPDTLGWILLQQGQVRRALELLQRAATLAPANPGIRYHYAVALVKSGDKIKARKELEGLLTAYQQFPEREDAKRLLKTL